MLEYLESHYFGVILLLLVTLVFGTWASWLFSIGRYKNVPDRPGLMFVLGDLAVKIINDFRHLLALVLVLIFAAALSYAMYVATTLDELSTALQLVMSTLGGLVGSIVGYYFGESAVKRALKSKQNEDEDIDTAVQDVMENINPAQRPPKKN